MATAARGKKPPAKAGGGNSNYYIPPLPVVVAPPVKSLAADMMGWIFSCVLIGLLLPLLGFLYVDILETKQEVKIQLEKVERLRREIERERREKKPSDAISDNPVFDRVRRPFPLPMPRP
jgi:hypothetical protein